MFEAHDKSLPFDGPEKIDAGLLETFDYEYPGRSVVLTTTTNEFTAVCPYSGLPDFGELIIEYVPDRKCIELRSLKYYLTSYRNVGMFYEHIVNRMLEDLVRCCEPVRMTLTAHYNIRGGLKTSAVAEYRRDKTVG